MENSNGGDDWLAKDKLHHVIFGFSLTLLFATIAIRTRYPFFRRHYIRVGSVASLFAGAAKEAADELGYFKSAGASAKDAAADVVGVLLASIALSFCRMRRKPSPPVDQKSRTFDVSMV